MDSATETKTVAGEKTTVTEQTIKGKLVEFEFWMHKQGYAKPTVKERVEKLVWLQEEAQTFWTLKASKMS